MPDKSAMKEELHNLKCHRDGLGKKIGELRREHNKVTEQIDNLERALIRIKEEPRVSDHALLRWFERKLGYNLEDIREEILGNGTKEAIQFGAIRVSKDNVHLLISKEGCVTTVLAQEMKVPHRSTDQPPKSSEG